MSSVYGVRSYGRPYFAAVQASQVSMDNLNAPQELSSFEMDLSFSLQAMPQRLASEDEAHPLMSYADWGAGGDLAWIGVSPNGRIMAKAMNGATIQSTPGLVTVGTRYGARLETTRAGGDSNTLLNLIVGDQFPVGSIGNIFVGGGVQTRDAIIPSTFGQAFLFNGVKAQTRCACTIFEALLNATDSFDQPTQIRWPINEKSGETLGWEDLTPGETPYPNDADLSLTMGEYIPVVWPPLYGLPSGAPPDTLFRWDLVTPWTKRELPQTVWARKVVV